MIKEPAPSTLAKYGLSLEAWQDIIAQQEERCGCCKKSLEDIRTVIDHEHVRGWLEKPDEERVKYVRGVCCVSCNHYVLTRYADATKHRQAAEYLDRYAARWAL